MLHLICNTIKIVIHTEEKHYDKSIDTEVDPYIYYFIIVSSTEKPSSQKLLPFKPQFNLFARRKSWPHSCCQLNA